VTDPWLDEVRRRADWTKRIAGDEVAQAADRALCAKSFFHWIGHYGWVYNPYEIDDPTRRTVPFVLWESQKELSLWLDERERAGEDAMVPKSRKIGVTWLVLHKVFWRHRFEPGFSALLGSRKEELVDRRGDSDSLFERLRFLEALQPPWLKPLGEYADKHLLLRDAELGSEITGESTQGGFGQGKRRTLVFVDEAGKVDTATMRLSWTAIESVARSNWFVFNPPPLAGHFIWRTKNEMDPRMVREMTWRADPNRPDDFKESRIRPRGRLTEEQFAEQYECKAGAVVPGRLWPVSVPSLLYDEDEPGLAELRRRCWLYGGMDFGSSLTSRLVCLLGLLEKSDPWRLWIEWDLSWLTTAWTTAAVDIMEKIDSYPLRADVFFDPAGKQRESDGNSWVRNLGGEGVPFLDLQAVIDPSGERHPINSSSWISWSIRHVLELFDSGQIRVHKRCRYLQEAIQGYRVRIPDGVDPLDVGGARSPDKNDASHGADALRHLASGVYEILRLERLAGQERGGVVVPDEDARARLAMADPGGPW